VETKVESVELVALRLLVEIDVELKVGIVADVVVKLVEERVPMVAVVLEMAVE